MSPYPLRRCIAALLPCILGAIANGVIAAAPARVLAQDRPGGAVVRGVVMDPSGTPLPYSVVSMLPEDRQLLTDDAGRFAFAGLAPGTYRLRARHLGYHPLDTVMTVSADSARQVELRLTHLTVVLSEMRVVARGACVNPGAPDPETDASLSLVFGELRENADRALALAAQFPFVFLMERRVFQSRWSAGGGPVGLDTVVIDGTARWMYRRGGMITDVIDHGSPVRQLNIPGLVQFADSSFANAHCFSYGGMEKVGRKRYIRVDFTPDQSITTPDIAGSAYLDPDSYQIARIVMSLTHTEQLDAHIAGMTVTSSFREIVPSIAILDSAEGVTSFEGPSGASRRTERQKTVNVVFTRQVPPGAVLP